jgi:hypothetical protein
MPFDSRYADARQNLGYRPTTIYAYGIHNARSILRDLRKPEIGSAVWARFKNQKEQTLWHYCELANAFQKLLPGQLTDELVEIVIVLENE